MRNYNIVYKTFCLVSILLLGCVESEDLVTESAKSGGALLTSSGSGKLLGIPDGVTGEVSFTDFDLSMEVGLAFAVSDVEGYAIVKRFDGQEVEVETFTTVPHTFELNSVAEYLAGFTGVAATDLRIGDVFDFVVKITHEDGRVLYSDGAKVSITVNCSSNLAGSYTFSGTWDRAETGNTDVPFGPTTEIITEVAPGVYSTTYTGHYSDPPVQLGLPICAFIFEDVCGVLTIPSQGLCDFYSNEVAGTGTVDPVTGNLHFEYSIGFGLGPRLYTVDYIKN